MTLWQRIKAKFALKDLTHACKVMDKLTADTGNPFSLWVTGYHGTVYYTSHPERLEQLTPIIEKDSGPGNDF